MGNSPITISKEKVQRESLKLSDLNGSMGFYDV